MISGSPAICKPSLYIWKFSVHTLLKPGLKDFEHYPASIWNEHNCTVVCTFLGIAPLWDTNENWPFPVLWPLLSFPDLLAFWWTGRPGMLWLMGSQRVRQDWATELNWTECNILTTSSSTIWKNSAENLSLPLALFVVICPKVHMNLHSRMSGYRWHWSSSTKPSWLSGSISPFLYIYSMHPCLLFLTYSASVRSLPFLSCIVPILAWNFPLISLIFLKRSLVFPIVLFTSISLHCSFKKTFLSILLFSGTLHAVRCIFPFLSCFLLVFFPQLFVKTPPETTTLPSCIYCSWGWFWSLPPLQ